MKKIALILTFLMLVSQTFAEAPIIDLSSLPANYNEGDSIGPIDLSTYVTYSGQMTDLTYSVTPTAVGTLVGDVYTFNTDYSDAGSYSLTFTVVNDTESDNDVWAFNIADVPAALSVSDILIGGENQRRGQEATTIVTVTNSGGDTVTGLSATIVGTNTEYALTIVSISSTSVAPGAAVQITIQGFVPLDMDAVDSDGEKIDHPVGTLTITSDNTADVAEEVRMEAENNLEISDFDLVIDGNNEDLSDGETVSEVKPGVEIEVVMKVENTFSDNGNCDEDGQDCQIENVEAELEINDGDIEWDDQIDFGDIDSDDKTDDSLTFDIEDDVGEDPYDMEIRLTGEDENGARHGEYWQITLDVEKERDEILIKDLSFSPSTVSCDRDVVLTVEIENTGRHDQKKAVVVVRSKKLDIYEATDNFRIDENDEDVLTFDLRIPSGADIGTYTFEVKTYYDIDQESDVDTITLETQKCVVEEEEEKKEEETINYVDPGELPELPPNVYYGQPEEKEQEQDFFSSSTYIVLLFVGILIVILLILLLLAVMMKK